MKKIILLAAIFMTMTTMEAAKPIAASKTTNSGSSPETQTAAAPEFKTAKDSVSYAIGVSMASQLGSIPYEFNHSLMLEGFKAGIEKKSV